MKTPCAEPQRLGVLAKVCEWKEVGTQSATSVFRSSLEGVSYGRSLGWAGKQEVTRLYQKFGATC